MAIDATDSGEQSLETELVVNADADLEGATQKGSNENEQGEDGIQLERDSDNTSNTSDGSNKQNGSNETAENTSGPEWEKEADDQKDELSTGDKFSAFLAGGLAGSMGGKGGILEWLVPDGYESSPFYILGNVVLSFVPGLDTASDVRALVHSLYTKNAEGIIINGIAAIPGLGKVADTGQIFKTITKWTKKFPSGAKQAAKLLSKHLLGHLPNSISSKILNKFTDVPVGTLTNKGFSTKQVIKYKGKGLDLRKIRTLREKGISADQINKHIDEGYSPRQINLMMDKGLGANDLQRITDSGYSFGWVYKKLHKGHGIRMDDVSHYLDEGVDLRRVERLREVRIPGSDIRKYVDEGANLHKVADLRNQNIAPKQIRRYVDEGIDPDRVIRLRKQDLSPKTIEKLVDNNQNLDRASKLRHQKIPANDIEYYARYGIDLRWVSGLRQHLEWSPRKIKRNLRIARGGHIASIPASKYVDIRNWCDSHPNKANDATICQMQQKMGLGSGGNSTGTTQ